MIIDFRVRTEKVQTIDSIEFRDASFGYEVGRPIFKQISFNVPMGKNILVTGPAGNGQSTFLKLLAVLVQPESGALLMNGHNTAQMSFEEFLPFRSRIGYTFDYGGLFSNRTLVDNLTLPLAYHKVCSSHEAESRAISLAREFGFESVMRQRPSTVSGGLRKLVCVLRAFILNPEVMVMDDPFTGIDPTNARRVISLIQARREAGVLRHLFFTSRDEVWPERLGYEPLIIENGVPQFSGEKVKVGA